MKPAAFQSTLVILVAAAWKIVFFFWDVIPFNSDEAVVALMSRHILQGERPVFFYGQAYMGSLDAFLVAAGFAVFGEQVWVIRLVQMLLWLGTLVVVILLGRELFGSMRTGLIAAALLAFPTVNVMLYTTASLGGYGEALLIGSLLLLVAVIIVNRYVMAPARQAPWGLLVLWGLLAGGGLWANGLTLVFSVPAGLYLLWALWKCRRNWLGGFFLAGGLGFIVGALPWVGYAAASGSEALLLELFGNAVAVEQEPFLLRTFNHLVNFLLLGSTALFGLRPPWAVTWLALPLLPFALAFWLVVVAFFIRKSTRPNPHRSAFALLGGVCAVLLAGFLFTSFGVDPSGRYFLPLAIPLALAAARMVQSPALNRWQAVGLVALVAVFQLWGTVQSALRYPPGLTTQFYEPTIVDHRYDQVLIDFLRQEGETRGYSNYWVSYPIAFRSQEQVIFIPRLPYHLDLRYTPRDDRYAPYTALVEQSQRVAYITTRNEVLDAYLGEQFRALGVTWEETQIGDYHVYYRLSRVVRPQEIGLGELRQ